MGSILALRQMALLPCLLIALLRSSALDCMPALAQDIVPEKLPEGIVEKSADVNGVRISYKIGGSGPVVVLLHGYAETSHMWLPLMPKLTTSHTVIAPDLRGFG